MFLSVMWFFFFQFKYYIPISLILWESTSLEKSIENASVQARDSSLSLSASYSDIRRWSWRWSSFAKKDSPNF